MDAEVSASHYVKCSDQHFLMKRDGWGTAEKPVQVEHYFDGETESSSDEVKLSLSIGGRDTVQKRSRRNIWDEKLTSTSSQYIIDLEESTHTVLSRDIESKSTLCCAACSVDSGNLHVLQSSCNCPNGVNKHFVNGIKRSESLIDGNKNCLEQNSLNQGLVLFHTSLSQPLRLDVLYAFLSWQRILSWQRTKTNIILAI